MRRAALAQHACCVRACVLGAQISNREACELNPLLWSRSENFPWIVNTYRTMGQRIGEAILDASAGKVAACKAPTVAIKAGSSSSDDEGDRDQVADQQAAKEEAEATGVDVHIDHLALAVSSWGSRLVPHWFGGADLSQRLPRTMPHA